MADPPPTRKVAVPVHELVRRIEDALPEWQQFKFTRSDELWAKVGDGVKG